MLASRAAASDTGVETRNDEEVIRKRLRELSWASAVRLSANDKIASRELSHPSQKSLAEHGGI